MIDLNLFAALVGLIGGFSGFIALFLQGWSTYVDAPRLKVKITRALNPSAPKTYYSIEVINTGGKPITLNNLGVRFENTMHSPFAMFPVEERVGNNFPFRLDSHSSQSWLVSEESTKLAIKELNVTPRIHAYVRLSTGKEINSEKITIDIQ